MSELDKRVLEILLKNMSMEEILTYLQNGLNENSEYDLAELVDQIKGEYELGGKVYCECDCTYVRGCRSVILEATNNKGNPACPYYAEEDK